ncbi:hypothetical protein [Halobaculum sp. MBLA0143]|uniref:hypothetical protein n=1 Tax=Halobaculum sp. MBLA0143 TaxID=3079933 RepID=UPI003525FDFA
MIDPRETYTVGPFVRLLDVVVERSQPYWEESTPKRVPDAAERLAVQTADTRAGRAVIRLFEPPEPLRQAGDDETAEAGNTNSETATGGSSEDAGAATSESAIAPDERQLNGYGPEIERDGAKRVEVPRIPEEKVWATAVKTNLLIRV